MRRYHKFYTSKFALRKFPLRILKFRAVKWVPLKVRLIKTVQRKKRKVLFLNHIKIKVRFKRPERLSHLYEKELEAKRVLYIIYGKSFSLNQLRKEKGHGDHRDHISAFLVKPLFKLDILIWYLDFLAVI